MTVQEAKAKEVLNNIWDFADAQDEEKGDIVDDAIIEAIGCMEEVEQYRSLGTVEELKEAMEKQVASKPYTESDGFADGVEVWEYFCPDCNFDFEEYQPKYCPKCGKKIDWSEEDD